MKPAIDVLLVLWTCTRGKKILKILIDILFLTEARSAFGAFKFDRRAVLDLCQFSFLMREEMEFVSVFGYRV